MWKHLELLNDVIRIVTFTHGTDRAIRYDRRPRDRDREGSDWPRRHIEHGPLR